MEGGRRDGRAKNSGSKFITAAQIEAEIARVERDHTIGPARRAEALATLRRALRGRPR